MEMEKDNFPRNLLIGVSIILVIGLLYDYNSQQNMIERLKQERIEDSDKTLEVNYYEFDYEIDTKGLTFTIKNPCLVIYNSTGNSMLPFWENYTLTIVDNCFPVDQLEVGDVITFEEEFDQTHLISHRIIQINYQDRWVRTKGDGNKNIDDFKGFEYITGKEIGFLNILTDKRQVENE